MKNWKDIAELIGIAAIVVSLIVVALELRQSTQQLQFATLDSTLGFYNDWRAKIIENEEVTELWRAGLAGEELTPNQSTRFRMLLSELMYAHQAAYIRITEDGAYSEDQEATMVESIAMLLENESVRERWQKDRFGSAYNKRFIDFVDNIALPRP